MVTVPTLLGLTLLVFMMVKSIPGDPAQLLLGDKATPDALIEVRKQMGLDQPLPVQYGIFIKNLAAGDLGRSAISGRSINEILFEKFPATIELSIAAMIFAVLVGVPLGYFAALRAGTWFDFASMAGAVAGVSLPVFWLGLLLVWFFGVQFDLLPISGRLAIEFVDFEGKTGFMLLDAILQGNWEVFQSAFSHLILPAITLGTIPMSFLARMTRASLMEVLNQDYVRTAFSKGLANHDVYGRHAFKNAMIPILTIAGLQFGLLLGGAMITETIFSWPGVGSWLLDALHSRDVPAIEGGVLTVACAFVVVNLFVDLLYRSLDPRVRVS